MPTNKTCEFTTNSFASNPIGSIALGFVTGMGAMFIGIMLGAPVFVAMALLIGGILFAYGFTIGKTTYAIYDEGVSQTIRRFIPFKLFNKVEERFIPWTDIRSYKSDVDVGRSMVEYEYLKLNIRKSPHKIWITDQIDKSGFQKFRDGFIEKVEIYNDERAKKKKALTSADSGDDSSVIETASFPAKQAGKGVIKREPGFYKTSFAKMLTLFFAALVVLIQFYADTIGLNPSGAFKLKFILIPGTVYIIYRTFVRK